MLSGNNWTSQIATLFRFLSVELIQENMSSNISTCIIIEKCLINFVNLCLICLILSQPKWVKQSVILNRIFLETIKMMMTVEVMTLIMKLCKMEQTNLLKTKELSSRSNRLEIKFWSKRRTHLWICLWRKRNDLTMIPFIIMLII